MIIKNKTVALTRIRSIVLEQPVLNSQEVKSLDYLFYIASFQ